MKENAKSTRLGWEIWFSAIVFGLVGVIAATYYHMMVRIRRSYVDV